MATARVEWFYPPMGGVKAPTGFRVYIDPDYTTPVAVVAYTAGRFGSYRCELSGLSAGSSYDIVVRAYNATGEESNTLATTLEIPASAPAAIESLAATAV